MMNDHCLAEDPPQRKAIYSARCRSSAGMNGGSHCVLVALPKGED
jgi:hypothetical protein